MRIMNLALVAMLAGLGSVAADPRFIDHPLVRPDKPEKNPDSVKQTKAERKRERKSAARLRNAT